MTTPTGNEPAAHQDEAAGQQPAAGRVPGPVVRRTRIGGVWVASALFAVILLLLLIFILENGHKVDISFLGAHGNLPLGVALLLAAVLGVLLVVIPGTGRIIQLRILARRHRKLDAAQADAAQAQASTQAAAAAPDAQRGQVAPQAAAGQQLPPGQAAQTGQPVPPEQTAPPTQYRP